MGRSFPDDREIVNVRGINWALRRGQLIDDAILSGAWEPCSTAVVEKVVGPGMVCLDVGANIGYYTMLLARQVGPTGRVYAAESSADACEVVLRNARINGFQQVLLYSCHVLGDEDLGPRGAGTFFNYSWPPADVDQRGNLVATVRADTILRGIDRLDFVKIDVDGWERKVLAGMSDLLSRLRPMILLEVCDYTLRSAHGKAGDPSYAYGTETREMLSWLQGLGYRFHYEETLAPVSSIEEVLSRFDLAACSTNLLCMGAKHA